MKEEKSRLGFFTITLMLVVAIFFDGIQALIQLIPILGQILASFIGLFAFLTFFLWFALKGMRFLTAGRIITMTGSLFVEIIPIANILPTWTLSIVLMAILTKTEKIAPVLDIIGNKNIIGKKQ